MLKGILKRISECTEYTYRINSKGFEFKRIYFGIDQNNSYLKIKTKDTFDQWKDQVDTRIFPIDQKIKSEFL